MRKLAGIIVLAAAASAAGCLEKDTTHTIYLSPDGRATWMAIESGVQSDETDVGRRRTEEQQYILEAEEGEHGIGRGLAALSPTWLRTRVIRRERPFFVVTEAEFSSLEFLAQRILTNLGVPGEVLVSTDGPVTTVRVRIDAVQAAEKDDQESEAGTAVSELLEELECYRFVVTVGRFVAAKGFTLSSGDTAAVPVEMPWDAIVANGGILELSLSWR